VSKAIKTGGCGEVCRRQHDEHSVLIVIQPSSAQDAIPLLTQYLEASFPADAEPRE
jgi:hypothetical protein